ncbi:hypothetical protein ATCV1_z597L [Acanthocystis turfacea chlorella virus 1]|uniref:Uncharacterized protein z597L n=1 Tax=Chlorovirus heliozoae TaxID=322019 RepID=A7K9K7_9PHYC|nr:hypothetical protein ATCV1_z597L [Acanthocystis turfacea chlorella virus 1]ABT16731.1 hypothetical protein ATCV1_z597L [Acanthocystis turfacea chlorella virus 1]
MHLREPQGKVTGVGNSRGQKDTADGIRDEDKAFFPHGTTRIVGHVVDFVKDDPINVREAGVFRANHLPEDLLCHHKQVRVLVDLDITSDDTNTRELLREIVILLVRDCLQWRRVNHLFPQGGGIFCEDGLSRSSGHSREYRVPLCHGPNRVFLPLVELVPKGVYEA